MVCRTRLATAPWREIEPRVEESIIHGRVARLWDDGQNGPKCAPWTVLETVRFYDTAGLYPRKCEEAVEVPGTLNFVQIDRRPTRIVVQMSNCPSRGRRALF